MKAPSEPPFNHPPLLELVVPGLMLVGSLGYAWSLRGVTNGEMNLLLLRPLFVLVWVILLLVILREVIPAVRASRLWHERQAPDQRPWRERIAPGTQLGAGLVVLATLVFAFFGPGDGAIVYIASVFVYLAVTGYLLGDRTVPTLILRAACCTLGLYLVMGVVLDVRL